MKGLTIENEFDTYMRTEEGEEAMFLGTEWRDAGRPGYLGSKRDEMYSGWDHLYGRGRWMLGWKLRQELYTDYLGACALYEDAYFIFLTRVTPETLESLIRRASNVYDVDPSDVDSKLDYHVQQHGRTHVQDIAIRRVLIRLGRWFQGDQCIQIRFHKQIPGKSPVDRLSLLLNPGSVPFHMPELIEWPFGSGTTEWYQSHSVEAFYQFNKHLLVR